jgi:hypothetical protein
MALNGKYVKIWKETTVAKLSQYSPGGAKENQEQPRSG